MAWRLNNPSHNLAMVGSSSSPAPPPIPLYHSAAAETGDMKLVHNHMPPIPGNFLFILHSFVHSYSYSSSFVYSFILLLLLHSFVVHSSSSLIHSSYSSSFVHSFILLLHFNSFIHSFILLLLLLLGFILDVHIQFPRGHCGFSDLGHFGVSE